MVLQLAEPETFGFYQIRLFLHCHPEQLTPAFINLTIFLLQAQSQGAPAPVNPPPPPRSEQLFPSNWAPEQASHSLKCSYSMMMAGPGSRGAWLPVLHLPFMHSVSFFGTLIIETLDV